MVKAIKNHKLTGKQNKAVQTFYDNALVDPEIQKLVEDVTKHPEMTKEFYDAMDTLFLALDKMCQDEIRKTMTERFMK